MKKRWQASDYFHIKCVKACSEFQVDFPVIKDAQKLVITTIGASGERIEKELNPELFKER